ncbi:MAG: hypothetical protein HQL52_14530 [Magnetococcales bacterium]|nr:hypothetical protein [Magnetococcales bacterium]
MGGGDFRRGDSGEEQIQLLLEFPLDPVWTFDNFIVGEGSRLAFEAVRGVMAMPATALTLVGEEGTGKSHLLHAAVSHCREKRGEGAAFYLDLKMVAATFGEGAAFRGESTLTPFLEYHGERELVAVDRLDELEASAPLQEGVLFLFNRLRSAGHRLLFAGRKHPSDMTSLRKDLSSRLLWGPVMPLAFPDEPELEKIVQKMAADRQVSLTPELLKFLLNRLPRRVTGFDEALEKLDRASLRRKRPLTVHLAKEVLGL